MTSSETWQIFDLFVCLHLFPITQAARNIPIYSVQWPVQCLPNERPLYFLCLAKECELLQRVKAVFC